MADRAPRSDYEFGQFPAFGSERTPPNTGAPFQLTGERGSPVIMGAPPVPYGGYTPPVPVVTPPPAPANPFAQGSPLNTLYGVDSESYLTDDQRKLARQIQGKFDASLQRRDRALAQYGAPRLSSFVEDEALARAMSLARGLNYKTTDPYGNPTGSMGSPRVGGSSGGGGGGGRTPAGASLRGSGGTPTTGRPPPASSSGNKWSQIFGGLSSIIPLLMGKDAYGNLLNKGLFNTVKEAVFGKEAAPYVDDEAFRQAVLRGDYDALLNSQGANGSWDVLPDASGPGVTYDQFMGPPEQNIPDWDVLPPPVVADPWADYSGDYYGDYWYPDWGNYWDDPGSYLGDDPFGIGGW